MKLQTWAVAIALAVICAFAAQADSVVTYHNSLHRHGDYIVPGLTLAAAAHVHRDTAFKGKVIGHVYAQPLYWKPPGASRGEVIVATESNTVYALDADTGSVTWQIRLGKNARRSDLPCGDIDPIGVTGTPVIDPGTGVLYLDALMKEGSHVHHRLFALSLKDGTVLANWPVDVEAALKSLGTSFSSATQGERSALLFFDGFLYVNYGGNYGDCGTYHGTVIQVQPSKATVLASWQTRANGGGIWAQGGMASDGQGIFVTTGNTFNATQWSDGEAIIRLRPGLKSSENTKDYFAPANWQELDNSDEDLGGTEALPLDVAVANSSPAKRVIALGKDGNAYLVDRPDLGGIGGQLAVATVSNQAIRTAPAVYSTSAATMLAFTNAGSTSCAGSSITMLNIAASGKSPITQAWCAALSGAGAPIITTTDGVSQPIVWVVGAEGDDLLHGFNAMNGQVAFAGDKEAMSGLHHFQTILVANRHFYVGADERIYAFTF